MKIKFNTSKLALSVSLGLAINITNSIAQESQETPNEDIEVILVTSQLRTQTLQEVPVAVTAFNAEKIERAGIKNSQDFVDLTPNVSLDDSFTYGNTFISIRGLSQINNADSPVAIVVDGVPQNNQKQFKMKLFDIERIEVLKGPQGSLYGRNAIGGAISIITKQPSDELEGFTNLTVGNGGLLDVSAGLSSAIIEDELTFRIAGSYLTRDGLIDNDFLNTKVDFVDKDYSIKGNLRYTPNADLSIDFRFLKSSFDAGSSYDVTTNSVLNPSYRSGTANSYFAPDSNFLGSTQGDTDELTLKIDYELNFATLTAITNSTSLSEIYNADLDFSNPNGLGGFLGALGELRQSQDLDVDLLSQELRLVSNTDSKLQWIFGGFYIETDRKLQTLGGCDDDPSCAAGLEIVFGLPFTPPSDFTFINRAEDNDNKAWSVFGQIDYSVSDKTTIQLGARYDKDEREQTDINNGGTLAKDFSAVQPKLSYNYQYSEDILAYASYSTGFRSGGFNAPGLNLPTFDEEFLQNFELGWKASFSNDLIFNSALFYSKSDDYQFFFVDAVSAAQFIANIDKVDIWGFDADFSYEISEQFSVIGGIGITDTEIKSLGATTATALTASGVDTSKVVGNKAPKNTPVTFNIAFEYEQPLANDYMLLTRVDYEYRGKKYWQVDNLDVQDPLNLINVRVGLSKENWAATLWVKNLSDEEFYTDFNPAEFSGSLTDIGFPAQPRTFGLDFSYKFN